ncbi:hypothetical protein JYU34_007566 [Plutella xylostella]|uniref:Uncharacterized protein n=1 Tax=Plutella xylostella TaxID=51655 RepID=A0ABQ7QQQ1_PLUXY|nr:hypothetical protein JYU34_007566 [Plutella xylostella]
MRNYQISYLIDHLNKTPEISPFAKTSQSCETRSALRRITSMHPNTRSFQGGCIPFSELGSKVQVDPQRFPRPALVTCIREVCRSSPTLDCDPCNQASRKISKCGYLFVAPGWDFSNPLYRTKVTAKLLVIINTGVTTCERWLVMIGCGKI